MKYLFIVIGWLACILTSTLKAQIGEPRHSIALGGNVGVTLNTIGFDPTIKQSQLASPTAGLTFRTVSEKYFQTVCALQVELNYACLGWKEDIMSSQNVPLPDTYSRKLHYIQLPVLARLGWGREQNGWMGYFLAGPQVGFCFGETEEQGNSWSLDTNGNPDRPNGMFAQYGYGIDHKFDYGITAGAGVEYSTSIGHFTLDARYYYGLSDIYRNGKKDIFGRSNHGTISIRLTYLLDIIKD